MPSAQNKNLRATDSPCWKYALASQHAPGERGGTAQNGARTPRPRSLPFLARTRGMQSLIACVLAVSRFGTGAFSAFVLRSKTPDRHNAMWYRLN